MRLFRRRAGLPADRRPSLARDERVVAWASVDSGGDGVVVATNLGLFVPGRDGRLGWHEINKATWSGRALTVLPARVVSAPVVSGADFDVVEDLSPETFTLPDPGDVPDQVRARVTRSVAYSAHHPLPGGGVRVVARRVPGVDGLSWAVRYDPGTPAPDGSAITELVAVARSAL